ncbi:PilW family protein [Moorella sulfitireducens]|uniref:PilW family protein n=1 Tax=Neomoorella sulfitireducens TaxID=2972948 RepID=UPI0021ACDC7A
MKRQVGFTLLEVVVTLAIAALVLLPLTGLLQEGLKAFTTGTDSIYLQEQMSLALDRFGREVRQHPLATVRDGGRTLVLEGNGLAVTLTLAPAGDGSLQLLAQRENGREVWLEKVVAGGFRGGDGGSVSLDLTARRGGVTLTLTATDGGRR